MQSTDNFVGWVKKSFSALVTHHGFLSHPSRSASQFFVEHHKQYKGPHHASEKCGYAARTIMDFAVGQLLFSERIAKSAEPRRDDRPNKQCDRNGCPNVVGNRKQRCDAVSIQFALGLHRLKFKCAPCTMERAKSCKVGRNELQLVGHPPCLLITALTDNWFHSIAACCLQGVHYTNEGGDSGTELGSKKRLPESLPKKSRAALQGR